MVRMILPIGLLLCVFVPWFCAKGEMEETTVAIGAWRVAPDHFTVDSKGGSVYATVTSNGEINLSAAASWVQLHYDKTASSDNLVIHIDENREADGRTLAIHLGVGNGPGKQVLIKQAGKNEDTDGEEGTAIRVANYNIRVAVAADERSGNGWSLRKQPLTALIGNYDLDIVGMQEASSEQLDDIKALLPAYASVSYPYGGKDGKSDNATILYKKGKFDVLAQGEFWYSETPEVKSIGWDATDQRICTWAKMKYKPDGQMFYFFTSHFYYQYATAKHRSGRVMVDQIAKIRKDNLPVISTGDLNSGPGTPQVQTIQNMLEDAYRVTETPPLGLYNTTFHGGIFTGTPVYRTDYIFVSDAIRVRAYSVSVESYGDGKYPSDHLPVICDLRFQK